MGDANLKVIASMESKIEGQENEASPRGRKSVSQDLVNQQLKLFLWASRANFKCTFKLAVNVLSVAVTYSPVKLTGFELISQVP